MENQIGYFRYNNNYIYIVLDKNNKIRFKKSNNDEFIFFSDDMLLKNKIINLFDTRNLLKLKNIKLNIEYELFYNKKTRLFVWKNNNNQENLEDNILLNFLYNHTPNVLYNSKDNKKENKYINHFIKHKKMLIAISILSTISIFNISSCINKNQNNTILLEKSDNIIMTNELNEITSESKETTENYIPDLSEYNFETIKSSINYNKNLSEEEKSILLSMKFIFDDNNKYMDLELINNRLKTVNIVYNAIHLSDTVEATYNIEENTIYLKSSSIKKSLIPFIHEFLHSLQSSYDGIIMELSNQFFTNEVFLKLLYEQKLNESYFYSGYENIESLSDLDKINYLDKESIFSSGYNGYVGFYYILAELLPENIIREYQFNSDKIDILLNAIEEIDPKKDYVRAIDIIMQLTELKKYNLETGRWTYESDVENLYNLINSLYQDVKGKKITEDIDTLENYLLDESIFVNKKGIIYEDLIKYNEFKKNLNDFEYIMTIPKTYLSNINSNSVLIYVNRMTGEIKQIEITDEIENKYNEYQEYIIK